VSAADVMERALARDARRGRMLRRVAGVVAALGVVGGGAYAAPGSPVAGWVRAAAERLGWIGAPAADPPQGQGVALPSEVGLSLLPGERLVIEFTAAEARGYLGVVRGEGAEVDVRSASAATTFTSEPERLLVGHYTADTMQVRLPRSAGRLEIRVGARVALVQEGDRVTTDAPSDAEGRWLIPLGAAAP